MARRLWHLVAAGAVLATGACGASGSKDAGTTTSTTTTTAAGPTTTAAASTTSTSETSTSTTQASSSTTTPSTSTGRLDAGVFSVTSQFVGASKWTVIAKSKPTGGGGFSAEGTVRIMGPGTGHGRADITVRGPAASLGGLTLAEVGAKAISTGRYTVTAGPTNVTLGGEPALAYAANQDTNKVAMIVTLHNGGTFVATLTASPDIFPTVTRAFRYIFESLKFA